MTFVKIFVHFVFRKTLNTKDTKKAQRAQRIFELIEERADIVEIAALTGRFCPKRTF